MLWPCSNLVKILQWAVKQLENGRYTLYARGAPTAESDRLLYALLIDSEKAEEWIITKRNNDQYTWVILDITCIQKTERDISRSIEKADRSAGWVKQDGDNPQVRFPENMAVLVLSEAIGLRSLSVSSLFVPVNHRPFLRMSSGIFSRLRINGLENKNVNLACLWWAVVNL